MRNLVAQPKIKLVIFQDSLPRHNNNINHISSYVIQYINHDYNPRKNNKFMGFSDIELDFPFIGGIDITLDYDFRRVMKIPPSYKIV